MSNHKYGRQKTKYLFIHADREIKQNYFQKPAKLKTKFQRITMHDAANVRVRKIDVNKVRLYKSDHIQSNLFHFIFYYYH